MIRQFDVLSNPNTTARDKVPYIVVIQSHHFDALDTVLVAPIFPASLVPPEGAVMLGVEIESQSMTLDLALIANIERKRLGRPVANLVDQDYEIRRAIDRLLTGF